MQIYDFTKENNQYYAKIGVFWAWGASKEQCLERLAHNIATFENE